MEEHNKYMSRCIELAYYALGYASPNPLVGAVVVHNGKITGEGYHAEYGKAHAEVNAINNVKNHKLLPDSTLYVSLEPCCHHGKTPPCTDLIIKKGIKNVVVGMQDPFPDVAGRGIQILKDNGINVISNVLQKECKELNKRFITYYDKKRPYIILKWAQTADGFIDINRDKTITKRPTWITSQNLKMLVHKWRHQEDAIMVGTNTAIADNPMLNIRNWKGKNPLRVVIDKNLKLPKSLSIFNKSASTIVFNSIKNSENDNISFLKINFNGNNTVKQILDELYKRKIQSLIVEGGRYLLQSFIDEGLWDEARIFKGGQTFGDGVEAPLIKPGKIQNFEINNELVIRLINYNLQ